MIEYNPGKWSITFAFSLKGSVFPKAIVWAFPCSLISVVLHIIFQAYPDIFKGVGAGDVGTSVLAGFTFVLGFLVVFRSQQAYSRWWEGGTLLQQLRGEWFNAFSSLMAFCNQAPEKQQEVQSFQHKLARLCSLLYCTAIQQVSTMENKNYELIDITDFNPESMRYMMNTHDRCEVCLQWIQRLIHEANDKQTIKVAPPILSRVYNQLGNGIVNLNNARKITDFPIPFPLAQMITFMLLFHWIITAFVCAASVDKSIWAGILSFIVTMSFWSINYIAVELEQPFGDDPNDLPLHEMQTDLNKSLEALMNKLALHPPEYNFVFERCYENKEEKQLKKTTCDIMEELFDKNRPQVNNSNNKLASVAPESVCIDMVSAPAKMEAQADQENHDHGLLKEKLKEPLHLAQPPAEPFVTLVTQKLEDDAELGMTCEPVVAQMPLCYSPCPNEQQVAPASRGDVAICHVGPGTGTVDAPQHERHQPPPQPLQQQQQQQHQQQPRLRQDQEPDIPMVSSCGPRGTNCWGLQRTHNGMSSVGVEPPDRGTTCRTDIGYLNGHSDNDRGSGQQEPWQMTQERPEDLPKAESTTPRGGMRLLFGFI